jgi:hypothetical protein
MTGATNRFFGRVLLVTGAGGAVVERDDGAGRVYVASREVALVNAAMGDRLIFSIRPGDEAFDAVLDA